ncbi:TlpA family protein disulfide reductase [Bacillus sp. WMMC1349]|uniref:TlpA family protein disulfide reductase n=1 Tax=Bacillus sp. WMMC1349 TaxID=2736254 RepID=UPI001553A04F|nr:TlpA disulfide reductase family protein [Bacillus sp. WMMC1349]NPC91392.1 TlpA family protein disulfide reductase [Bacillus sp. WMMC1349]
MKKQDVKIPKISQQLPWINAPNKEAELDSKDYHLLYFWSVSCPNCEELADEMLKETESLQKLKMIAVHIPYSEEEKSINMVKEKIVEKDFRFAVVMDQNYEIAQACQIQAIPSFCLFNPEGDLELHSMGDLGFQKLMKRVKKQGCLL